MGGDFIGSDLVRLSTGYDFLKGAIDVALGEFDIPALTEHKCAGVYFLCKETERLKSIFDNSQNIPEIVKCELNNNELKAVSCSADRSGYLIYRADSLLPLS